MVVTASRFVRCARKRDLRKNAKPVYQRRWMAYLLAGVGAYCGVSGIRETFTAGVAVNVSVSLERDLKENSMMRSMSLLALLMACTVALAMHVPSSQAVAADRGDGECVGDVNDDGIVDISDLVLVLSEFGCTAECDYDVNGDGVVDVADVLMVLLNFGPCEGGETCETSADCDDGDPCTVNICIDGQCVDFPNPNPNCN